MNAKAVAGESTIALLSVSGGLSYLEFGGSDGFANRVRNRVLQAAIGEKPNDGLVGESSANVSRVISSATHENRYADYRTTNHTHLVRNQGVADRIVRWLGNVFARRTLDPAAAAEVPKAQF